MSLQKIYCFSKVNTCNRITLKGCNLNQKVNFLVNIN